jgi:ribosome biogenesis GTP-binding protein ylqF
MSIQWFPGHMHQTKLALKERLKRIDLVIELLDARIPGSSCNPLLERLAQDKVKLKLLNKSDLADPVISNAWLAYYRTQRNTQAFVISAKTGLDKKFLLTHIRTLLPQRGGMSKPLRLLIVGIPNVGKSFFINRLLNRAITKTGDEPGITRKEQHLFWKDDVWIYDTPGILWEKITPPQSAYRLAAVGSMGKNAYDAQQVALHLCEYLQKFYWAYLVRRYCITDIFNQHIDSAHTYLTQLARLRGAIFKGGELNYQKIAELFIQDFRSGQLGRISLERPEEWLAWKKETELQEKQR